MCGPESCAFGSLLYVAAIAVRVLQQESGHCDKDITTTKLQKGSGSARLGGVPFLAMVMAPLERREAERVNLLLVLWIVAFAVWMTRP